MPRALPWRHVSLAWSRRLPLSWPQTCPFRELPCAPAMCRQGAREWPCGPNVQTHACTHLCAARFCWMPRGGEHGTSWRPLSVSQSRRFPCGSPPRCVYHPEQMGWNRMYNFSFREQAAEWGATSNMVTSSWARWPISQFFCFQNTQPSRPLLPHTRHPKLLWTASSAGPQWTKVLSKDSPALLWTEAPGAPSKDLPGWEGESGALPMATTAALLYVL